MGSLTRQYNVDVHDVQKDGTTHCLLGKLTCQFQIYCVWEYEEKKFLKNKS